MNSLGDLAAGGTHDFKFPTHKGDGTPITLAGTPAVSIYKDNSATESTTGVTLTVDFDGQTGMHNVNVVMTDAFYAAGHNYQAVLTAGTVDSISVIGAVIANWSIENRATAPMVAAIWNCLLTAITTAGSIGKLLKDDIDAAISTRSTYAGGAVASVTGGVTVSTNNDKTGYSLAADQAVNATKWAGQTIPTPAITGEPVVTLASAQAAYAPAKAGDKMDIVDAPSATGKGALATANRTEMDSNSTRLSVRPSGLRIRRAEA
jgi:hypothetical protein